MEALTFDVVVDWLGLVFCPVGILYGIVLVASLYTWPLPFAQDRKVPDYCSLFQLVYLSAIFFTIGIGGFDRFFAGKFDGEELIVRCALKTAASVVLLMTSTMLSVFEIKRWIGRNRTRG